MESTTQAVSFSSGQFFGLGEEVVVVVVRLLGEGVARRLTYSLLILLLLLEDRFFLLFFDPAAHPSTHFLYILDRAALAWTGRQFLPVITEVIFWD